MFVYVYCLSKRRFLLLFLLLLFCVSVARWGVRSVEQSVMNGGPGIWHRNTHARKRTSTLRNTGGRQAGKRQYAEHVSLLLLCWKLDLCVLSRSRYPQLNFVTAPFCEPSTHRKGQEYLMRWLCVGIFHFPFPSKKIGTLQSHALYIQGT